jgi:toxin YoeB
LEFDPNGFEDLAWWVEKDRQNALRIIKLIKEVQKRSVFRNRQARTAKA